MGEDIYSQKLAWFKQNEKPEVILLVADDHSFVQRYLREQVLRRFHAGGKRAA